MTTHREPPWEIEVRPGFWADGAGELEVRIDGGYHGEEVVRTVTAAEMYAIMRRAEHFWAAYKAYKVDYDPAAFWAVYGE
jgi:hypothetical protein